MSRLGRDAVDVITVERLLATLYLGDGAPRREEQKKAREVADLLTWIARVQPQPVPRQKPRLLVDAAAGHGYVGLCAAALLGWRRVVAIERDGQRLARVRTAAQKIDGLALELRTGTLGVDAGLIPDEADLVVALHACGPATDGVLDGAMAARARNILCAPCCYGAQIDGFADAVAQADALRLPDDAGVRGRFCAALVDGARLDRLHRAGYDAQLVSFTAPTVTPHHLLFRARRGGRKIEAPSSRAR